MSNVSIELDNVQNKAFLWNLMYEKGIFKEIQEKYLTEVKKDFENKIILIKKTAHHDSTLTDLNKAIIIGMIQELNKYKYKNEPKRVPITSAELSQQNQQKFKTNLEALQTEFSSALQIQKPIDINFSDTLDKPIGSEMDNMLASAIAMRENELNVVLDKQDPNVAEEWINRDNVSNVNKKKKITFEDIVNDKSIKKNDGSNDFISLPRTIDRNEIDLYSLNERIKIIEKTQQEILQQITQLKL